jgi:hypothetical protein
MSIRGSVVDFDLHGFVGIRLIDASAAEADAVRRQLGPIERELDRAPDLIVRFVDSVSEATEIRILGADDVGFSDDAFLILRGRMHAPVRVAVPLDRIGQGEIEILCERGTLGVPLLIALVNLCALGNGVLPLHASAFVHRGVGVLVTGWAKGGKTETLLAFMSRGARYIGDEWIYIDPRTREMRGIPEPMRLWDWPLRSAPEYARAVRAGARVRLQAVRAATRVLDAAGKNRVVPPTARRVARRLLPLAQRQLSVQVPPRDLFMDAAQPSAELQRVVLVGNHAAPVITTAAIDAGEIARRMVFSVEYERQELMSYYHRFRFAIPDRTNRLLEERQRLESERLLAALEGTRAFTLLHPYPVNIPALFDALDPVLEC